MSVTFAPLTNHLLLALEPEPERSSIIAVQRGVEDLTRFGRITAIGPEVRDLRVGQRVLASITAGVEIQEQVVMITEDVVLGIEHG